MTDYINFYKWFRSKASCLILHLCSDFILFLVDLDPLYLSPVLLDLLQPIKLQKLRLKYLIRNQVRIGSQKSSLSIFKSLLFHLCLYFLSRNRNGACLSVALSFPWVSPESIKPFLLSRYINFCFRKPMSRACRLQRN